MNQPLSTPQQNQALFVELSRLLVADMTIHGDRGSRLGDEDYGRLVTSLKKYVEQSSLVYTAFDGDHFELACLMRKAVLAHNKVPVNPDSVLNYYLTVRAHSNKRDVLVDDLSILKSCTELWVFTEVEAKPESISQLAEGVLIELLFFKKRHEDLPVYFVNPIELMTCSKPNLQQFAASFQECKDSLLPDQLEVCEMANGNYTIDSELRKVLYFIADPLDCKYVDWSRTWSFAHLDGNPKKSHVPLAPWTTTRIGDLESTAHDLGKIVASWAVLMRLADHCYLTKPMTRNCNHPKTMVLFRKLWSILHPGVDSEKIYWRQLGVPKAKQGKKWPITTKEGRELGESV